MIQIIIAMVINYKYLSDSYPISFKYFSPFLSNTFGNCSEILVGSLRNEIKDLKQNYFGKSCIPELGKNSS